jgi:hypothetical protein
MKAFISYSWDSKDHKEWVLKLAMLLTENGVYVLLDQFDLKAGKNMNLFMEKSIEEADKVLIILTPNYKIKSENRKGGVGFEYSICTQRLFENQRNNEKFIPVLRSGDIGVSAPSFLKVFLYHDMSDNSTFDDSLQGLLRVLYDTPLIKRPKLGIKPDFGSSNKTDERIIGFLKFNQMIRNSVIIMQDKSNNNEILYGISTGFNTLDKITSGFQSGNLIVIGGRTGIGKTSLVLSVLHNCVFIENKSLGFFSLELPLAQLTNKLLSIETQIPLSRLSSGNLQDHEWEKLDKTCLNIEDSELYASDESFENLKDIQNKFRYLKTKHNIQLIILDCLQAINFSKIEDENKGCKLLLQTLKQLAKELDIPILITTNLNSIEISSNNIKPKLSDLPNSSIIESIADIIIFIHRPEKYGILLDEEGNSLKGIAELIVAKNRFGLIGYCDVKFDDEFGYFKELEYSDPFSLLDIKSDEDLPEDVPF